MKRILLLLSIMTLPSTASAMKDGWDEAPAKPRPLWATNVHNLMIDVAFPDESPFCLARMYAGSREVDDHQGADDAHMHAMRGPRDPDDRAALNRTWRFIDLNYAEARNARFGSAEDACYFRGRALHPIMDATSPAHHGYREWNLLKDPMQIFDHGDWLHHIKRYFPLPLPLPGSKEDLDYLDDHPELLSDTAAIMRLVDSLEMEKR